jgi:hypothetical protein
MVNSMTVSSLKKGGSIDGARLGLAAVEVRSLDLAHELVDALILVFEDGVAVLRFTTTATIAAAALVVVL